MSGYQGDITLQASIQDTFSTNTKDGVAVNPSAAFTAAADIVVRKDGTTNKPTPGTGVTVTNLFTGMHQVVCDTSDTSDAGFWAVGSNYVVMLNTTKTVDGESPLAANLFSFSIENRAEQKIVGLIGVPAVTLSADIAAVFARTDVATSTRSSHSAADAADATWDENIVSAHGGADTAGLILSALTHRAVTFGTHGNGNSVIRQIADNSVTSYNRANHSLQAIRDRGDAAWTTGAGGSAPTADENAIAVWDKALSAHQTAGSAGRTLSDAMPAAQINTTAGSVDNVVNVANLTNHTPQSGDSFPAVNTNLDATVSSRMPTTHISATGGVAAADVVAVSGDTGAADNLEADYDGTGYAKTNSTVGTVTTLTGHTPQTGDSFPIVNTNLDTPISTVESKVDALDSRIPAALIGGKMDSDVQAINGDAVADEHLRRHSRNSLPVTFAAGGSTTTAVLATVDGAAPSNVDGLYNGRVLIFDAGAGLGQGATRIEQYDGTTNTATVTAMPVAIGASATAIMV